MTQRVNVSLNKKGTTVVNWKKLVNVKEEETKNDLPAILPTKDQEQNKTDQNPQQNDAKSAPQDSLQATEANVEAGQTDKKTKMKRQDMVLDVGSPNKNRMTSVIEKIEKLYGEDDHGYDSEDSFIDDSEFADREEEEEEESSDGEDSDKKFFIGANDKKRKLVKKDDRQSKKSKPVEKSSTIKKIKDARANVNTPKEKKNIPSTPKEKTKEKVVINLDGSNTPTSGNKGKEEENVKPTKSPTSTLGGTNAAPIQLSVELENALRELEEIAKKVLSGTTVKEKKKFPPELDYPLIKVCRIGKLQENYLSPTLMDRICALLPMWKKSSLKSRFQKLISIDKQIEKMGSAHQEALTKLKSKIKTLSEQATKESKPLDRTNLIDDECEDFICQILNTKRELLKSNNLKKRLEEPNGMQKETSIKYNMDELMKTVAALWPNGLVTKDHLGEIVKKKTNNKKENGPQIKQT